MHTYSFYLWGCLSPAHKKLITYNIRAQHQLDEEDMGDDVDGHAEMAGSHHHWVEPCQLKGLQMVF